METFNTKQMTQINIASPFNFQILKKKLVYQRILEIVKKILENFRNISRTFGKKNDTTEQVHSEANIIRNVFENTKL